MSTTINGGFGSVVTGGSLSTPAPSSTTAAQTPAPASEPTFEDVVSQVVNNILQIGNSAEGGLNSVLSRAMDGNSWSGPDGDPAAGAWEAGEEGV